MDENPWNAWTLSRGLTGRIPWNSQSIDTALAAVEADQQRLAGMLRGSAEAAELQASIQRRVREIGKAAERLRRIAERMDAERLAAEAFTSDPEAAPAAARERCARIAAIEADKRRRDQAEREAARNPGLRASLDLAPRVQPLEQREYLPEAVGDAPSRAAFLAALARLAAQNADRQMQAAAIALMDPRTEHGAALRAEIDARGLNVSDALRQYRQLNPDDTFTAPDTRTTLLDGPNADGRPVGIDRVRGSESFEAWLHWLAEDASGVAWLAEHSHDVLQEAAGERRRWIIPDARGGYRYRHDGAKVEAPVAVRLRRAELQEQRRAH